MAENTTDSYNTTTVAVVAVTYKSVTQDTGFQILLIGGCVLVFLVLVGSLWRVGFDGGRKKNRVKARHAHVYVATKKNSPLILVHKTSKNSEQLPTLYEEKNEEDIPDKAKGNGTKHGTLLRNNKVSDSTATRQFTESVSISQIEKIDPGEKPKEKQDSLENVPENHGASTNNVCVFHLESQQTKSTVERKPEQIPLQGVEENIESTESYQLPNSIPDVPLQVSYETFQESISSKKYENQDENEKFDSTDETLTDKKEVDEYYPAPDHSGNVPPPALYDIATPD